MTCAVVVAVVTTVVEEEVEDLLEVAGYVNIMLQHACQV